MSKDMKMIMESWRKQVLSEGAIQMIAKVWSKVTDPDGAKAAARETEKIAQANALQTVGELIDLIKIFKSKERALSGAKKLDDIFTGGVLEDVIDDAGDMALELFGWLSDTYLFNKPKAPQDTLKFFRVDPSIAAIVDNDVEEAFLQWFLKQGVNDTDFRNKKLSDFNMNVALRDFIAKAYKARTVAGPDNLFK